MVLDDIQKGDGVAAMVDDMEKLAVLFREMGARFEIPGCDTQKEAERLESEARAIREGSAAWRVAESGETLKDRRDRAFTLADRAIAEIRAAARFAFRNERDGSRIAPYVDSYRADAARRTRSKGAKSATSAHASSVGAAPTASPTPPGQK